LGVILHCLLKLLSACSCQEILVLDLRKRRIRVQICRV
jgi:hypothetical protein